MSNHFRSTDDNGSFKEAAKTTLGSDSVLVRGGTIYFSAGPQPAEYLIAHVNSIGTLRSQAEKLSGSFVVRIKGTLLCHSSVFILPLNCVVLMSLLSCILLSLLSPS